MSDGGMHLSDLDILVAAILSGPNVDPPSSAADRVRVFKNTLAELAKTGGAYAMWQEANGKDGA